MCVLCYFVHQNSTSVQGDDPLNTTIGSEVELIPGSARSGDDSGGRWSWKILKYSLVLIVYTLVVGAVFHQLLEENQLDVSIRKKVPVVF